MIAWMQGKLLLRVVLLVPLNNQKSNLTLQSATKRTFWDKKLRPTRRSLWDRGNIFIVASNGPWMMLSARLSELQNYYT